MKHFESIFLDHMKQICEAHSDPSHDILHVHRVVSLAKHLSETEKADLQIVLPAAYLHDRMYISKQEERRSQASRLCSTGSRDTAQDSLWKPTLFALAVSKLQRFKFAR